MRTVERGAWDGPEREVCMKKKLCIGAAAAIAAVTLIVLCIVLRRGGVAAGGPKLYYGQAQLCRGQEAEIDVKLKGLEGEYPAASFEIAFDRNKLEFLEVRQGNLEVTNLPTGETVIPEWQFSRENANSSGTVNLMYLDMTAGDNPISGESTGGDVLFRLVFRVKDSCGEGETLTLTTEQATFAAVNEEDSLAVYKDNIAVPEGEFQVEASK